MIPRTPGYLLSRCVLLSGIAAASISCEASPTEVSETEIWRLELEQTHDGSTAWYRQRGTVSLVLRLNQTTQPDPTCEGQFRDQITTFLAHVEAPGSRLQSRTRGTASGSWNCHAFSAEVRLDDGTVYDLTSDLEQGRLGPPWTSYPLELPRRWTAGTRQGTLLFAPDSSFRYAPYDSHLDVRISNRRDEVSRIGIYTIDGRTSWERGALGYGFDFLGTPFYDSVAGSSTRTLSWPSHRTMRLDSGSEGPMEYRISARVGDEYGDELSTITCLLSSRHPDVVDLIVHEDGRLECGTGWLGEASSLSLSPDRLFLQPGRSDTVMLRTPYYETSLTTESSHPGIQPVLLIPGNGFGPVAQLVVTAATDAPRTEHGIVIRQFLGTSDTAAAIAVLGVEVYELGVSVTPDTITLAPGQADSLTVVRNVIGLIGLDVDLSLPNPPAVLNSFSFSPGTVDRDSSVLALRVDGTAEPGIYAVTVCATIRVDPRQTCHPAELTLIVPATASNAAPVASNDSAATVSGVSIDIDVLANDSDADGDSLVIGGVGTATSGVVQIVDGGRRVRYTPTVSFTGPARFTYVARDARGAESNEATVTVTVTQPLRYDLAISTNPSSDVALVGQEFHFIVFVSSSQDVAAEATNRLPASFTYTRHEASAGSYDPATGIWTIDTVPAGPFLTLRVFATADSVGTFTNIATLTGGIEGDTNPSNNADSASITIAAASGFDLEVTKTVDRDTVAAGDTVTFTLVATNHGPELPASPTVIDQLPSGFTYVSDDGGNAYSPASGSWSLGFMPAGQSRTLRITVTVGATATNTANIVSESAGDTDPSNNSSSVTVTVAAQ